MLDFWIKQKEEELKAIVQRSTRRPMTDEEFAEMQKPSPVFMAEDEELYPPYLNYQELLKTMKVGKKSEA